MDTASSQLKAYQCSKCSGDTEYHCLSCPCDLCPQCKENHVKDLKTIDHDVVSHHDKINCIPTQEICVRHPSHVFIKYCEPCELPVCCHCRQHRNHRQLFVKTAYHTKRQQHKGTIHTIRSEALFYRPVFLPQIKAKIKTSRTEFSHLQSQILTKAQRLKDFIDYMIYDLSNNVLCNFDFRHRCLEQRIVMNIHIASIQRYVHKYEQSAISPIQFLLLKKAAGFLPIHPKVHTSQLSMTESLNKEDIIKFLSEIFITKIGNGCIRNEHLLKLMSAPEVHQYLTVTGVDCCLHISCVTSDLVWVSDKYNLILTDTTGVCLHRVEDLSWYSYGGIHTVNRERELIYIDRNYNINKLSKDMKTTTTFIERTCSTWEPKCVYWSPSTGDLLVGMCYKHKGAGKVTRYNQSGHLIHTIQHDNTGRRLYRYPVYITENNNGDVVVSDFESYSSVVVTERGGRHRFSYTGYSSSSRRYPDGICTDILSHILVCDSTTKTVHILSEDGQFLSHFLIRPSGIFSPHSLSYDVNTHRLWVGSSTHNMVVVYRFITLQDTLNNPADVTESMREIQISETEKNAQMKHSLLKMMPSPILQQTITITDARDCFHISHVASDQIWISDYDNKLLCSNTNGETLFKVLDMCKGLFVGSHTVNAGRDLIYIDINLNIMKLSKDRMIFMMLVKRMYPKWRPRCVYCSISTGDLLVGIYLDSTKTGLITHYNQLGELTNVIQQNNTGQNLYCDPLYITENNNGDVVVSDFWKAVVVTERGGRHRFSYTGYPSGSGLQPWGICTDALSHILVCDGITNSVQLLDSDGQFLLHILTFPKEIFSPVSLSYDAKTNHIWVGSRSNNKVFVYKHIT